MPTFPPKYPPQRDCAITIDRWHEANLRSRGELRRSLLIGCTDLHAITADRAAMLARRSRVIGFRVGTADPGGDPWVFGMAWGWRSVHTIFIKKLPCKVFLRYTDWEEITGMGGKHKDLEKQRTRVKAWTEVHPEKQQTYRARVKRRKLQEAKTEPRRRATLTCPHCSGAVPLPDNTTFVMRKHVVGEEFRPEDYVSNPDREYKRPEADRRRQLAYYWRNRDRVLARMKAERVRVRELMKNQTST